MMKREHGGLLLRTGISILFLYFGLDKFLNVKTNVLSFQNLWLTNLIPVNPELLVYFTGVFEIIVGLMLLAGVLSKITPLLASGWTFLIFLNIGFTAGIYDLGLTLASLSLYFTGMGSYTLTNIFKKEGVV